MAYTLEARTCEFAKNTLFLLTEVKKDSLTKNVILQLSRCVTSIGANYREANSACSRKDFRNKISIARKEANETEYWFEILESISESKHENLSQLRKEAHEIALILGSIYAKTTQKI